MTGTPAVPGRPQPSAWGKDRLSEYLDTAHQNRLATFANKADSYARLAAIDDCFAAISDRWTNPASMIQASLFIRAHGAYRAACEAAMAGASVEAALMSRAILETAGYIIHMYRNPGHDLVWLGRHDPDAAKAKAARDEFQIGRVRRSIAAGDRAAEGRFKRLYDDAIDFGAHPNERALSGNLKRTSTGDGARFDTVLLHADGIALDYSLITVARCGHVALEIVEPAFRPRFEILGVRHRLLELRSGL